MTMDERCDFLGSLGFTILHNDSSVEIHDTEFDFSAIELTAKNVFYVVINQVYKEGIERGEENHEIQLRKLCGIDD